MLQKRNDYQQNYFKNKLKIAVTENFIIKKFPIINIMLSKIFSLFIFTIFNNQNFLTITINFELKIS